MLKTGPYIKSKPQLLNWT